MNRVSLNLAPYCWSGYFACVRLRRLLLTVFWCIRTEPGICILICWSLVQVLPGLLSVWLRAILFLLWSWIAITSVKPLVLLRIVGLLIWRRVLVAITFIKPL